jgi:glycosyltransferase involved in cell wall biosynthesis
MVCELATAQSEAGWDVQVYCGVLGPAADALAQHGVRLTRIPSLRHAPSPGFDRRAVRSLRDEFAVWKPDLVHTHSSKGGLLGRIAAKRCGVPSVYTAHGWPFQEGAARQQRLLSVVGEWVGARLGQELVCVTTAELLLAERFRIGRVGNRRVIHNGVAFVPPTSRLIRSAHETFNVVMVARLDRPKRPDLVLRAIALCDSRVRLQFVGDGALMVSVRELAESLEVQNRVDFLGDADPSSALARADCFVLLSDYEGMPVTVLEAMRAGLPVVANSLPGIVEAVNGSENDPEVGLLVAGEADAVATALMSLVEDPQCAYKMGLAGRSRWQRDFSAEHMCAQYDELYRRLIEEHSTRP